MSTPWKLTLKYETLDESFVRQEHIIDETPVFGTKAQVGIDFVHMLEKTKRDLMEEKLGITSATVVLSFNNDKVLESIVYSDWGDEDMAIEELNEQYDAVKKAFEWLKEEYWPLYRASMKNN